MRNIFNLDNKFFTGLNKIIDALFLNLLFFICCIPIVTIGASMSAMYYTMHKNIVHNRGYMGATFWGAFKSNFKNSTITSLIHLGITLVFSYDIWLCQQLIDNQSKWGSMIFLFMFFIFFLWIWAIYCYAYFARFDQACKPAWKTVAIIAIANLGWSLLIGILFLLMLFLIYLIPITLFFAPVLTFYIYYFIFERIFRKYMSPEDIAREEEEYRRDIID